MKRLLCSSGVLIVLIIIWIVSRPFNGEHVRQSTIAAATPVETPQPDASRPEYPGKTIDEVFPIISEKLFSVGQDAKGKFLIPALNYKVEVNAFTPIALYENGQQILKFKARSNGDYWSNLVGVAHLLGNSSQQIYIVSTGPGGPCCTNYWIVDATDRVAREVFRSEEFGWFRDPMEIFDFDGDGIYELVQFDSCFRYFMNECGACAPEPRVMFKFDKRLKKYRPAVGIMQDFARKALLEEEKKLGELAESLKFDDEPGTRMELDSIALDSFVQRLHIGDEDLAWRIFKKYFPKPSRAMVDEIRNRLANCEFYKSIHKANNPRERPRRFSH